MYSTQHTPTAVCQWHHNPQIIGSCPRCGAYICPHCALPLPYATYKICPSCFKTEYTKKVLDNEHRKTSAIVLTILGILFTIASFIFSFFHFIDNYAILAAASPEDYIYAITALTNSHIVLLFLYVIGFLFTTFCGLGFFFGLRSVWRWFKKLPIIGIVFSVIFFVVVIIFALQIAWLIGGFVMIGEFIKIHNEKKAIQSMTNTISTCHINM